MQSEKEQVALTSIAASAALAIAKAIVGVSTGSLAILSEAGHSFIDLGATVMTYAAVRVSGKPADEEHHYGHGKVESISALGETALLFLLSGVVVWEAVKRLIGSETHTVEATIWAFGVIAASIVIDFFRARALTRTAQATQSQALEADALHFSSDLWSSLAVLVGLLGVHYGLAWADSAAAIAVAGLVCVAGWRLGKRTIDTLTDVAPPGAAAQIEKIACAVPGVVDVEHVRARGVGETIFVDLTVAVSRTLPLDRVTTIKQQLTRAIRGALPAAELTITTEPKALDDETVRERVMVIARDLGLAIHHVAVQTITGRLSVSVDLEVDGSQPLTTAHEVASRLEDAIRRELGPEVEVETHIEPLPADLLSGHDADPTRIAEVRELLASLAAELPALGEIHDVRVRETAAGEIVNFHCHVDPALSVSAVHDVVDSLERRLRRQFPTIQRVIGHAEPRR